VPVATGSFMLLIIAVIVNNIPKNRRYPFSLEKKNEKWFSDE